MIKISYLASLLVDLGEVPDRNFNLRWHSNVNFNASSFEQDMEKMDRVP